MPTSIVSNRDTVFTSILERTFSGAKDDFEFQHQLTTPDRLPNREGEQVFEELLEVFCVGLTKVVDLVAAMGRILV